MSSFVARSFAAAAIIAATVAFASPTILETLSAPPSKPNVALLVEIDAGHYRDYLDDKSCTTSCDNLRAVLRDDVRELLEERYPFLNWVDTDAADTVLITWANGGGFLNSQLEFRMRGPVRRMAIDKKTLPFEENTAFLHRSDEGWAPESLRVAWVKQLRDQIFKPTHPELVSDVFGRIPLKADVAFKQLRAIVSPTREMIERAAKPPSYALRVHVKDPVDRIDDEADLHLTRCVGAGREGHSCPLDKLYFANDSISTDRLEALLGRSAIAVRTVRVLNFEARQIPAADRGPTGRAP